MQDSDSKEDQSAGFGSTSELADVGTLLQTKEAFRQSETYFHELAGFVKAIFWLTSPDGRYINYVSPGYETLWRRSLENLCENPRSWLESVHPDDRARLEGVIQDRQPEAGWEAQYRIVHPDGAIRWIRDRRYPVRNGAGKVFRLAGITIDITSLKASERKLEFTQYAIDHAADLVFWITPEGNFTYVNQAACRALGYRGAELEPLSLGDIVARDGAGSWREVLETLRRQEALTFEWDFRAKDGRTFPVEIGASRFRFDEEVYYCFIARDVAARRQAERDLARYAADLERANESLRYHNRELDEFAYLASHDLKEPLRAIITFSQLLEQDLGGSLPEIAERDLQFISNAAERMQRLINDLLALSHAGRAELRQERANLRRPVDSALTNLSVRIRETGARIRIDELPEVTGDPTLLAQLYQNLIGNALKFAGERPPDIHILAEQVTGGWVFGVRDQGIGIKSEHLEKVFQPFRRLHAGSPQEGTGIGLAICRKVVERHGGRLWVESAPGQGSCFRFSLEETGAAGIARAVESGAV